MRSDQYEDYRSIQDIVDEMMMNEKKTNKNQKIKKKSNNLAKPEPYQELMKKEDKMTQLMEDIHNYKVKKENKHDFLLTSPLHVIIYKLFNTINDIGNELRTVTDINDVISIFLKKDRLVYTGIIIVISSLVMLVLISM